MVEFFFSGTTEKPLAIPIYHPPIDSSSEGIFNDASGDYLLSFSFDCPPDYDAGDASSPAYVDDPPPPYSEASEEWVGLQNVEPEE